MAAIWVWIVFSAAVLAVLAIDVLVFHRRAQEVRLGEAARKSMLSRMKRVQEGVQKSRSRA